MSATPDLKLGLPSALRLELTFDRSGLEFPPRAVHQTELRARQLRLWRVGHRHGILGPPDLFATRQFMSNILDKIIATKRDEIADRKQRRPVVLLGEEIAALGRPRNFFQAVTHK